MVNRRTLMKAIAAGATGAGAHFSKGDGIRDAVARRAEESGQDLTGISDPDIESSGKEAFREWRTDKYDSIKNGRRNHDIDPIASYDELPNKYDFGTYFFADNAGGKSGNLHNAVEYLENDDLGGDEAVEDAFREPWMDSMDYIFNKQSDHMKMQNADFNELTEVGLILRARDGIIGKTVTRDDMLDYAVSQTDADSEADLSRKQFNQTVDGIGSDALEEFYSQNDWEALADYEQTRFGVFNPKNWVKQEGEFETRGGYNCNFYV